MKAQREFAHMATRELLDLDTLTRRVVWEERLLPARQGPGGWEQRKELGLNSGLAATGGE